MRTTQAHVKVHDALCRAMGRPLPEVRYDLRDSSAALWAQEPEFHPQWSAKLARLGRQWLARRMARPAFHPEVLATETRIDLAVLERLENGVATTCGGIL